MRNAYKRQPLRERVADEVWQACQDQSLAEKLKNTSLNDKFFREKDFSKLFDSTISQLAAWDDAAARMSGLVKTVAKPDYPGEKIENSIANTLIDAQIKAMKGIGELVKQVFNISVVSVFDKEELLFRLSRTAGSLLDQHRSFAKELKNDKTKKKLIEQAQLLEDSVCKMIENRWQSESLPHYYEKALAALKDGSLHEIWKNSKNQVLDGMGKVGGNKAADDLQKLFAKGLGVQLDAWVKRQKILRTFVGWRGIWLSHYESTVPVRKAFSRNGRIPL